MKAQFIAPERGKIEYIIGIDFGHGETSAAICRVDNNKDPEDIDLTGTGKKAIPSTMYISPKNENAKILIGKEAVVEYGRVGNGDFYAYFKQSPDTLDESKNPNIRIMKLFMRKVYESICTRYAGELMEGDKIKSNHVVFIACPSQSQKWDDTAMQNYVKLALDAGLPIAGAVIDDKFKLFGIVRESRAAYIRALQKDEAKQIATKGILVVDYGSSTIDITYYREGEKPIDKGYQIGASFVEEGIFNYLKEFHDNLDGNQNPEMLQQIKSEYPSLATKLLYSIRESKENFYTDYAFANAIEIGFKFKPRVNADKIDVELSKMAITDEILASYICDVKAAFEDFKKNVIKNNNVTLLVLTGGASRMNFVQDLAKSVFGEQVKMLPPQDPSLTVSNGIATAGRADVKLYHIAQEALSNAKIISPDIFNGVIEDAANYIAKEVIDDMHSSYEAFKNQYSDESVVSLKERISSKLKNRNSTYKSRIQTSFNYKLKSYVNNIVDTTLKQYVQEQFPEFDFGQIKVREIKDIAVNISNTSFGVLEKATNDAVEVIEAGTIEVAIKALWDGTAIILAGALKLIGEGAALIHKLVTGKTANIKSYDEFYEMLYADWNDKDTLLKKSDRQRVYSAFDKNKSLYESSLTSDVEYKLKWDSDLKAKIQQASKEAVEEYVVAEINEIQRLIK